MASLNVLVLDAKADETDLSGTPPAQRDFASGVLTFDTPPSSGISAEAAARCLAPLRTVVKATSAAYTRKQSHSRSNLQDLERMHIAQ